MATTRIIPAPSPRGGRLPARHPGARRFPDQQDGEHFDSAIGVALQLVERFKHSPSASRCCST